MRDRTDKLITGMFLTVFLAISGLTIMPTTKASPTITAFFEDLAGFNAVADSPPIVVNFDDITPNTDITGSTIGGITFSLGNQPAPSASLIVVRAVDTYTPPGFDWSKPDNRLYATSGENVLSPGGIELAPGPNPLKENDDLELTLSLPVAAIGFDILYQSLDGGSFTAITLLDTADSVLYYNNPIPIPGGWWAPGGTTFVGFVSDSCNIAKIIIDDYDGNNLNPDSNIGFDTIRLGVPVPPVANFDWDPLTPNPGELVKFDASSSESGSNGTNEMPITEYRWNFADGNLTTTSAAIIHHSFSSSGFYYVTLTVYAPGAMPETNSTTKRVTVIAVPVGGYSVLVKGYTAAKSLMPYLGLLAISTASFVMIRRRIRRRTKCP
jgi:hypothetical protein